MSNFICPVKDARLTSKFGYRNIGRGKEWHQGVDLASPVPGKKVPIYAAADGKVLIARNMGSYGLVVIVEHSINGQRMDTTYAHLDSMSVKPLQKVKKGQPIGIMGNTGGSFGVHLHFEIHNGPWASGQPNAVDPMKYIKLREDELSVSEAKHLQSQINELNAIVKSMQVTVNKKANVTSNEAVSPWAKNAWDWAVKEGLLDGSNPRGILTREQQAVILQRVFADK